MAQGNVSRSGSDHGHPGVRIKRYLQPMKHRYAALLPLAFALPACFGQTPFEYADQRTHNTWFSTISAQSDGWTIGGSAGMENSIFTYGFIAHLSGTGDTLWTAHPGNNDFGNGFPAASTRTQDDHVLLAGDVDGCDTGPFDQGFLMSIAPDGSIDWQRRTFMAGARDIAIGPTGAIALLSYDMMAVRSGTGDSLYQWSAEAKRVFWASDSTLLICSDSAVLLTSWSGAPLGGTDLPWTVACYGHESGHLLAIRPDGRLFVLDDGTFSVLDSVQLDDTFNRSGLLRIGSTWRAIGDERVLELDDQYEVVGSFTWDPSEEFPADLFRAFATDGAGFIAMTGTPLLANRTTGLVRVIGADGSIAAHPTNVAIEVASVDSTWYTGTPPIIFPRASVSIRVTNQSTEILEDLVLNSWINAGICSAPGNTYRYHTLGLAQGEDTILAGIQPLLWYGPFASVDSQYFCIAALSPNNLFDRDQSDNLACDTAHIVLGMRDLPADGLGVMVTDPFAGALDMVFIAPPQEPLRATLFDATGRQLAATTIAAGSTRFHWDLPGLSDGVHVLRLEGRSASITRKLVHQQP
jgi:hypothetical protein